MDYEERIRLIFADCAGDVILPSGRKYLFKDHNRFKQTSYSKWAFDECLAYVIKRRSINPVAALSEFINKMVDYSKCNSKTKDMFSIAINVAYNMRDVFIAMK